MIKVETLGMIDVSKVNPVITSQSDVANYTFLTDNDEVYLISNTMLEISPCSGEVIKAGEYLNGFLLKAWEGQKLVIDEKHIAYGDGEDYSDLAVDGILTINEDGKLEIAQSAPESGVYFEITDVGIKLTEKAIKAKIVIAG